MKNKELKTQNIKHITHNTKKRTKPKHREEKYKKENR